VLRRLLRIAFALFILAIPRVSTAQTLELALHAGPAIPSESDESLAALAYVAGATANARISDSVALGALVQNVYLRWHAQGAPGFSMPGSLFPDDEGSLQATLIAPNLRWYLAEVAYSEIYLQAAIGYARYATSPQHPSCSFELPVGLQLSAGLDAALSSWTRLGLSFGAQTLHFGKSCTEEGYAGRPPDPPSPSLALAGQLVFTTIWNRKDQASEH
jgi:hypothetical protein